MRLNYDEDLANDLLEEESDEEFVGTLETSNNEVY